MSSPITLSNFNNIDFSVILNAVMAQESQPLTALQTQQSNLASESNEYNLLATKLGSLETAAAGLSTPSVVTPYTATVSDSSAISVTPTGNEIPGSYNVVVNNLAQSQVTASASTAPDANTTTVATGGTLTIGGVGVTVTGAVTLQGLATQINGTTGINVTASVVQSAPGAFRLVLTSAQTGQANAFTVSNGLTGGSGVTFTDTNNDGVSGDSAADNALQADDASISVNNLAITSSSNTLTSAIPGTTLTLLHADPSATLTASISPDDASTVSSVKSFVSAYNDLMAFISDQKTQAANGTAGTIAHEALVQQARSTLRSAITGAYGSGTFTHLAEVGIGFNQTGQLTLDTSALSSALTQDRASVAKLFAGTSTIGTTTFTDGAFGTLQSAIDAFTQTGGLISGAQLQLTSQGTRLDTQIADMQARLAVERAALQQEYTAADQAMTDLKSQSGNLSSLGSSQSANPLITNGSSN
jgi:flagellar hook-associated protein 2